MFQDANHLAMRVLETSVKRYECAGGRAIEMKRMCIGRLLSYRAFGTHPVGQGIARDVNFERHQVWIQ